MSIININVYYKNRELLVESFSVSGRAQNLDDARYLVLEHLNKFYSDVKYKVNLYKSFEDEIVINLDFEEDLALSRELKLREIFKND